MYLLGLMAVENTILRNTGSQKEKQDMDTS